MLEFLDIALVVVGIVFVTLLAVAMIMWVAYLMERDKQCTRLEWEKAQIQRELRFLKTLLEVAREEMIAEVAKQASAKTTPDEGPEI